jgi:ethanolamine utilization protein EutN
MNWSPQRKQGNKRFPPLLARRAPIQSECVMFIGQITGEIVSTINHVDYDNRRLLIVDRLDPTGQPSGDYLIAVAAIEAGVGERVLVLDEGNGARQILGSSTAPVRSVVVGVVDSVDLP